MRAIVRHIIPRMRILIVTPLYPPDIAGHAPYVKELARRLSDSHSVTILTYNHIPERLENVEILTVPKKLPALIRILKCTHALMKAQKDADIVFFQNGPSIEIPLILASFVKHPPYLFRLGDETPLALARRKAFYRSLLNGAIARSHTVMAHDADSMKLVSPEDKAWECARPHSRPEILPFSPHSQEALDAYDASWREHVHTFLNIMTTMLL